MVAPGFRLLNDLPTLAANFTKEVRRATASGQREAIETWKLRTDAPGLAHRFTWGASKGGATAMRRRKYGSPTLLRINYARAGLGMPRESMPGRGTRRPPPNADKPWFVQSGGTRDKILARRPRSTVSGGTVITRFKAGGLGINLLGGPNMRGVLTATLVRVPTTYPMRVYKDSVARSGAYTVQITRAIPRWFHTYSPRTYRQEFEDLSQDLPWIKALTDQLVRRNLRALTFDARGRIRARYRSSIRLGQVDQAELASLGAA